MSTFRQPNVREMAKKVKVREMAEADRTHLLLRQPFIGAMVMRMDIIPVCDSRLTTAATDGSDIFLDCDFYLKLKPDERIFLLAHEVWHCVLLHFNRKFNRVHELWNIAADLEIQFILAHEDMKNPCPLPCKPGWEGYNAEEIYDRLPKRTTRSKAIDKHLDKDSDDCIGDPRKQPGISGPKLEEPGEEDGSGGDKPDDDKDNGSRGEQAGKDEAAAGTAPGKGSRGEQAAGEDGAEQGDAAAPAPQAGKGKGKEMPAAADQEQTAGGQDTVIDPDYSPYFAPDISERVRSRVVSVARQVERMHGKLPLGAEKILEDLLDPQLPWQELLAQFVTACYGGKRRWLPPSRRHVHQGLYLPSLRDQKLKAVVAVDTSGSTQNDLPQFFGELNSLLASFGDYELTVIQCDAKVQKVDTFSNNEPFDPNRKWEPKGFGGTDFRPVFKYIDKHQELAEAPVIFFTDGCGAAPVNAPPNPVLWLLCAGCTPPVRWGTVVKLASRG